jgi:hypothetical protein
MTASALKVAQLPGAEARAATLQLLHALFPAWLVQSIRGIFGLFPIWFVARHASVLSVLITYWLVGKSEIQDVDPALLDADTRAGWGNTPTGWVPGFALGGKWRPEVGASQGVLVERCRVLEASGCASVCANVCKAPTQDFFTNGVGLPLTMIPDYETQSCTLIFGASPPPIGRRGLQAGLPCNMCARSGGWAGGTQMSYTQGRCMKQRWSGGLRRDARG